MASVAARGNDDVEILPISFKGELADEIKFAYEAGARVVNMSFNTKDSRLRDGLIRSIGKYPHMLFIVSADNSGSNLKYRPVYPAALGDKFDNIITVAASGRDGRLLNFSNYGKEIVHVAALGEDVLTRAIGGNKERVSGASFAAPQVANLATQILSINPDLTPREIRDIIMATVDKKHDLMNKIKSGGVINRERALKMASRSYESLL